MRKLGVLFLALAVWLSSLRFVFREEPESLVGPLARGQLSFWASADVEPLRRNNPEWDLMARTFAVLGFANLAVAGDARHDELLAAIDRIATETDALERRHGVAHFLLPYGAHAKQSLFVEGEIGLQLAARALLVGGPNAALRHRVAEIERQLRASPLLVAESYPDEGWVFCNTVALAALRVSDAALGTDHSELIAAWVRSARAHLVDPATGMLISSFHMNGVPRDGPEGSTLWLAANMLQLADDGFAREQYALARGRLGHSALGFGWASEWPSEWQGHDDIDSGPTIPFVDANAGSSGFALLGARAFGDRAFLEALVRSMKLAAFPTQRGGALTFAAGNPLADAVTLYGLTAGPLWDCVKGKTTCTAPRS